MHREYRKALLSFQNCTHKFFFLFFGRVNFFLFHKKSFKPEAENDQRFDDQGPSQFRQVRRRLEADGRPLRGTRKAGPGRGWKSFGPGKLFL